VPGPNNAITDVPASKVGHFTGNPLTGTTVVLAEEERPGRGGA